MFSYSSGRSSSIRVPPSHSGEDSIVTGSICSSISLALPSSGSIVAAFNAAPISPFGGRATLFSVFFPGFLSTPSSNGSTCVPCCSSSGEMSSPPQLHWRDSDPPDVVEGVPGLLGHPAKDEVPGWEL